jgi:glucose/arabinose dehydrogenase
MSRKFLLLVAGLSVSVSAAPPGAMVRTKLNVPTALKNGAFSSDRFLNIPPGFQLSLFAGVSGARFMALAPNGDILVSQPRAGQVTLLRPVAGGGVPGSFTFVGGLSAPHDIVFHTIGGTTYVYIAEKNQIDRFRYVPGDTAGHDREVVVTGLPDSSLPELRGAYAHEVKNIAVGSDDHLYVSIGSSCNVCTEDTISNPVRAAIYQYNADGTGGRLIASGLRNAEGVRFLPGTNTLWAVVNHRDQLP